MLDIDAQVTTVLARLQEAYGVQPLAPCPDHLRELVLTILSHRTNKQDELQAFQNMWDAYGSWAAIQEADLDALITLLAPSRFPERKAPYIQSTLKRIYEERGEHNIDFLADVPTDEAMQWLLSLPGVGIKTASLLMLFCFHRPVMPVDTHVHRVSMRLGIIPHNTSAERAHQLLWALLPKDAAYLYTYHKLLLKHGQKICTFSNPLCARCPLNDICPSAFIAKPPRTP